MNIYYSIFMFVLDIEDYMHYYPKMQRKILFTLLEFRFNLLLIRNIWFSHL